MLTIRMIIGALVLCVTGNAYAGQGDLWIDVNGVSQHVGGVDSTYVDDTGTVKNLNERNSGLGVTYEAGEIYEVTAGFFNNSYYKTTWYVGTNIKTSVRLGDVIISPGVMIGLVTGYDNTPIEAASVQPTGALTLAVEYDRIRVNIGYVPLKQVFNKGNDVITFQLGLKF